MVCQEWRGTNTVHPFQTGFEINVLLWLDWQRPQSKRVVSTLIFHSYLSRKYFFTFLSHGYLRKSEPNKFSWDLNSSRRDLCPRREQLQYSHDLHILIQRQFYLTCRKQLRDSQTQSVYDGVHIWHISGILDNSSDIYASRAARGVKTAFLFFFR